MNGTHAGTLNEASLDKETGNNSTSSSPLEDPAVQADKKEGAAGQPNGDLENLSRSSSRVTNGLQSMLSRVRTADSGRDLGPPPDGSPLYLQSVVNRA
jgi:hypothetical protein